MDFAIMYIPSESVFYEIVNSTILMEYARNQRVYTVSPSTLYALLQVLLLSFEGKKLEQKTKEVYKLLRAIQKDHDKLGTQIGTLEKHINNAHNTVSSVQHSYESLGQKVHASVSLDEAKEGVLLDDGMPPLIT